MLSNLLKPDKKRRVKRKPVTILIGILCNDGIVVASDSQTSWGSGKSWNAKKISEVEYAYGRAVIAESGAELTSTDAIDHFRKLCSGRSLVDEHGLPGLAEMAIRKARDKLRWQNFECSSEDLQKHIEINELDCALMLAHYEHNDEPRIHTINLSMGIACRAKSFFETLGTGSDLANYLLSDLCEPNQPSEINCVLAAHVVEIVKRHDQYCGGPTKLGILRKPTVRPEVLPQGAETYQSPLAVYSMLFRPPIILDQSQVEEIVKMVSVVNEQTKKKRGELVRAALKYQSERRMKELLESFDDPERFYPKTD